MISFICWRSSIVSNVQSYFVFSHLIELTWRINDLISFDSHELWKYFWFERGCYRTSFGITKCWERLLNDCIYLYKLIFYCSVCLKYRGQIGNCNVDLVDWAWWILVFYFNFNCFVSKVCPTIHRVYLHRGVWNQLGKRRSTFNSCCEI